MMKRLSLILFLALLIGAWAVLGASAEAPELEVLYYTPGIWQEDSEDTIEFAVVPEEQDWQVFYHDTFAMRFDVGNYDEMEAEYGGAPSWNVDVVDAAGADIGPEYLDDHAFHLRVWRTPWEEATAHVNVSCDWGEKSWSDDFYLHFVPCEMPVGNNIPSVIDLKRGETTTIEGFDFEPAGYSFADRLWFVVMSDDDDLGNYIDWWQDEEEAHTLHLCPRDDCPAGYYPGHISIVDGNVGSTRELVFRVADEGDSIPELEPQFVYGEYREFTWYLFDEDGTGLEHQNVIPGFTIDKNAYHAMNILHGEPEWSCIVSEGEADLSFSWNVQDDGNEVTLWANVDRYPSEPCSVEFTATCGWSNGYAVSSRVRINFDTPDSLPDGLPTGVYVEGLDEGCVQDIGVGEELSMIVDWLPGDAHYADVTWLDFDTDCCDGNWWWDYDENGNRVQHFIPNQPGAYWARVWLNEGNLRMGRDMVIRVADEKGNEPDIFPVFNEEAADQNLEFSMPAGRTDWPVYVDSYITRIRLENYDVITTFYGDDPDWSFDLSTESEGAADVYMRRDDDNRSVEIRVNDDDYPDEPVSSDFVLKLTANGEELVTRDIHIDFEGGSYPEDIVISPIHNLTTDTYSEYGGVIDLTVGDTIEFSGAFAPEDYEPRFGDPWIDMGFDDFPGEIDDCLSYHCDGDTAHLTALQPGFYIAWIDMRDGAIVASTGQTVLIRVYDEEGNLPGVDLRFEGDEGADRKVEHLLFDDNPETDLHHQHYIDDFGIERYAYDTLRALYGEPVWSHCLTDISDESQSFIYEAKEWDDGGNPRGFDLWVDEYPDAPCSAVIEVTCAWPDTDYSLTGTVTIDFAEAEGLPEGLWIEGVDENNGIHGVRVGEELTMIVDWMPEGYRAFDRTWLDFDTDCESGDWWWDTDDDGNRVQHFVAYQPGVYWAHISLNEGNLRMSRDVLIYVADEEGVEPDVNPIFNEEASEQDLAFWMPVGRPEWPVFVDTCVTRIRLENYDVITTLYGDDPDWTFELSSDSEGGETAFMRVDDDNREVEIRAFDDIESPVASSYVLTLYANGEELITRDIHIDFVDVTYPEDIDIGREYDLTVGDTIEINGAFAPEGYRPNFGEPWLDMGFSDFPGDPGDYISYHCDGTTAWLTGLQPGIYVCRFDMRDGAIVATTDQTVVIRVCDDEGNLPGVDLHFEGDEGADRKVEHLLFDDNPETDLHHQHYIDDFGIERYAYDTLRALYGEPVWSHCLTDISDESQNFIYEAREWDDGGNPRGFDLWVEEYPDAPCSAVIEVTCAWPDTDYSLTGTVTVDFVEAEGLPEGLWIDVVDENNEIHGVRAGEELTMIVDWLPEGYRAFDRTWLDFDTDCEGGDWWWDHDDDGNRVQHFVAYEPGVYWARISLNEGNLRMSRDVLIYVADGESEEPDVFPILNEEAAEQDLAFTLPAGEPVWPVFNEPWVTSVELRNYDVIYTYYHVDPEWSLTTDDRNAPRMRLDIEDDNRRVNILVDEYPDKPTSASYVLHLKANGEDIITRDIHLDFINVTYPDGIDVGCEYDLAVGETIEINGAFAPEGYRPNFGEPWIDMGFNDFPGDIDDFLHYECNGTTIHVTALQPGTYVAWIDMRDGNINASTLETVVFRVHDEEGNVPGLDPVFDDEEYTMTMASRVTNPGGLDYWISEGDELFIRPGNQEALIGLYGHDSFEWSFETIEGEHVDMIAVRAGDGDDNFDIRINDLSAHQPGTTSVVKATLRCAKGDIAGETTLRITVHFIDLALPNSIQWDAKITMAPGEEYWTGVVVDPSNWHEGFLWYDVFENEWRFERRNGDDELTYMLKCFDNGVYTGACHIHAHNVFINGPEVTYRVTDGQYETLYLPAMLTEIEDSAFEGIAAEAVQIPYGVTSIGSRAFADCPNLMAVYIPGSVGYIADDAFDGSDNVELFWN